MTGCAGRITVLVAGLITVLVTGLMTVVAGLITVEAGLMTEVAGLMTVGGLMTVAGGMFWVCSELGRALMTVVVAPPPPDVRTKRMFELVGWTGGGGRWGRVITTVGLAHGPLTATPPGCDDTTMPVREL